MKDSINSEKYKNKLDVSIVDNNVHLSGDHLGNLKLYMSKYYISVSQDNIILAIIDADDELQDLHNNKYKAWKDGSIFIVENELELFALTCVSKFEMFKGTYIVKRQEENIAKIVLHKPINRKKSRVELLFSDENYEWILLLFCARLLRSQVHPFDIQIA